MCGCELMGFEPVPIMPQVGPNAPLHETVNVVTKIEEKKDNKFLWYLLLAVPAYYFMAK